MQIRLPHYPACAGADEAGRGPLAGPVVAAAVVLPPTFDVTGIQDSKRLDADQRELLAKRIRAEACWAIEFAEPEEVDRLNVLQASLAAMRRAILALGDTFELALIDGNRLPSDLPTPAQAIVKGDAKLACVAAASILAKTARDAHMVAEAAKYPGYGFERHFGYPTPEHLEALARLGPCPIHRRSFGPVRKAISGTQTGAVEQPSLTFPL